MLFFTLKNVKPVTDPQEVFVEQNDKLFKSTLR